MFLVDGHDRQPVASAREDHVFELRICFDFGEGYRALQLADKFDIDKYPSRIVFVALRVEIFRFRIKLSGVRVGLAGHPGNANNSRFFAVRMVEKHLVANAHIVAHHVAGLVVSDAVPHLSAIPFEVVDTVYVGLGFH